jgi:hypothetical protein
VARPSLVFMENKKSTPTNSVLDNFIGVWDNVFDQEFCDFIINYIDNTSFINSRNYSFVTDKQVCLSAFSPSEANYLMGGIDFCMNQYIDSYPYLKQFSYHSCTVLLQKTEPRRGGYYSFHAENTTWITKERTLAWTVYFNDIEDGGETEFLYQGVKVKPKLGRVAIWPGSFTHLHRGNPTPVNKYIATGWYAGNIGMRTFSPERDVSSIDAQ